MFSNFFIERPIFAAVTSIIILFAGLLALHTLPIAEYPQITPPTITVSATYSGATAQQVEQSVAEPIELQINGVAGMMYMSSSSTDTGTYTLTVTFALGTNPDMAQVDVQNRVSIAEAQLPSQVTQQGITIKQQSSNVMMLLALTSPNKAYDSTFLSNYALIQLVNALTRVPGVSNVDVLSEHEYAMRIWLNPEKMAQLGITAAEVTDALNSQNVQAPAGQVGQQPAPKGQQLQLTVQVQGRLTSVAQFENVIVRANPDGSLIHIKDIAQVELGSELYTTFADLNNQPSVMIGIYQLPTANALDVAKAVRAQMQTLSHSFPAGLQYEVPLDTTQFVTSSISDVLSTLLIAFALVFVVVFIFLQNWRATLIPAVVVPVSLIGATAAFTILNFSLNTLTLFGLVLAVGLVVDDAIVVVEAVQRHIEEDKVDAKEAAKRAMAEVSSPVIAIALVLAAVFIPVAFLGGITGQIYKQFALTLAVAVSISAFCALTLSPSLCALLLRPAAEHKNLTGRAFAAFNRGFDYSVRKYETAVEFLIRRKSLVFVGLLIVMVGLYVLFEVLPSSFIPAEDQGYFMVNIQLPDAAAMNRTEVVAAQVAKILLAIPGVQTVASIGGFSMLGGNSSSNVASMFVTLKPWNQRTSAGEQVNGIIAQAQNKFAAIPTAAITAFNPPAIPGLGATGGFQFELEEQSGSTNIAALSQVTNQLLAKANKVPELAGSFTTFSANVPQIELDVDRPKAITMGVSLSDLFTAIDTFLGGVYVNQFNEFGQVYEVMMQALPQYRSDVSDISQYYVSGTQNGTTSMIPLSTLTTAKNTTGPDVVNLYNMYPTIEIEGSQNPAYSSGQSMAAMGKLASQLPAGYGYQWTGLSYQEQSTQGQFAIVLGIAILFVFLVLAALYESWTVPLAVILIVPLGIVGSLLAIKLHALDNDIYAQIGFIMVVGLAAKNAILIVEFARMRLQGGGTIKDAAMEGAKIRFRPILMTSFAFIFGVLPLMLATGAGSAARHSLGTSVFGGMVSATVLGVLFVPVYFVAVEKLSERRSHRKQAAIPANNPNQARG
jgi:hydrophobe/amphiphile efflux-1 (HAE1) family protein